MTKVMVAIFMILLPRISSAQDPQRKPEHPVRSALIRAAIDPTSHVAAVLYYPVSIKDWSSSQFFFTGESPSEINREFTVNGQVFGPPISYLDGRTKIVWQTVEVEALGYGINAVARVLENYALRYNPPEEHRRIKWMFRGLRWGAEAYLTGFAVGGRLEQAHANEQLARSLGLR